MRYRFLDEWSAGRWAWTIFAAAFVWKGLIVVLSGHHLIEPMGEVLMTGRSLAVKGLFGDPFNIPTGPTAHVAPVIATVYGAVYSIFGITGSAQAVLAMVGLYRSRGRCGLFILA